MLPAGDEGFWGRLGRAASAAVLLCGAVLALQACTGDEPGPVGVDLVDREIDVVLQPLGIDAVDRFAALAIEDADIPLSRQEVLYLGVEAGVASAILVNVDFDLEYDEFLRESLFSVDSLQTVKLSLTKLEVFGSGAADEEDPAKVTEFSLHLYELTAPFDSTAYPGAMPGFTRQLSFAVEEGDPFTWSGEGLEIFAPIRIDDFLGWVADGGVRGFMLTATTDSDSGLVGFAARDLDSYNELADVAVGTIVGPNFVLDFDDAVELEDGTDVLLLPNSGDISTFHELSAAPESPEDGFILRTGLRSYPALRFDFSALPHGAFINRAVFRVTNDTLAGFGNLHSLVVSELDAEFLAEPAGTMTLDELGDAVYVITGQTSVDPALNRDLGFDVTQAVQRIVNEVYEGERGLVLTAGEDFAPAYDQGVIDPEFYFSQFRFLGTAAADSLRPRLEITYSLSEEITGGGR
ncbi:MAG: hypothetical protein AB7V45_15930 [Candidatus Krumholzibacteriia bacterium]